MNQWIQLWKKECLEMWRNFKWIWMPLVFIILGLTEPLSTYYMPVIMESVGGLPEGAVFEMPMPSPGEVLMMTTSQFNMLGILVIVFASMGLISSERRSGVAGLILVRPVPHASYVTAKWAGMIVLGWLSLFLGYLASWYYTNLLFGSLSFGVMLNSFLLYGLWFTFIITLTVFFNALSKISGLVAFATLTSVIGLSITTSVLEQWMTWSPAMALDLVGTMAMEGRLDTSFALVLVVTLVSVIALLAAASFVLKNKEMAS
ncbi:ABC transporter permease [Bacillus sp. FJAT-44742]|uniref:ABC transporter permease n=1 Tax=Bacillus sp. FJAT-44742 TaxID=2014005 RepID=UPI000C234B92|nr:ABC transporter permease [Bacillus sp. FJAT-44742]